MSDRAGLFSPDRIALIGATEREGSVGRALAENLDSFDGEVVPINPNREAVLGNECYPEIGAVPDAGSVEMAIVAVPAPDVIEIVRQLGEFGVQHVVVISAGFSETDQEGEHRERKLAAVANDYDLSVVGPNSVGLMSTSTGLDATFLEGYPPEGSISLMSQSGAFIAAVVGWAIQHDIGFNHVVSLGNEAVIDETEMLARWEGDPETDVILVYIEDIDDGRQFIETAQDVTDSTPVVVIKAGRTEAGAEAAASHTGSLAGSDAAYRAGLQQAGVLRALSIQDVFDFGQVLAGQPPLDDDRVAIVTNGGGPGVLTADAVDDSRLELAAFEPAVRSELGDQLPDAADVTNPLDIVGDADLDRFQSALDTVLAAGTVDSVVVLSVPTALYEFEELAERIGDLQATHQKPVVTCLMGGEPADRAAEALSAYGIPNYFDPERAVSSLEALATYGERRDREYATPTSFDVDTDRAHEHLTEAHRRDVDYLGTEAIELLEAYGIPTPAGGIAKSPADADSIAESIDGPVVMKLVSPDIIHKSDIGGVEIGVPDGEAVDIYRSLIERARQYDSEATVLGVRVEALVDPDERTETIIGAKRDPQFGHLLMFGFGGIFVQVFEDTAFRVAPVTEQEARQMTRDIQAAPMLRGARGRTPADVDTLVETIQRVSQLVTDFPAITELDINPLIVSPAGVSAVDVRLTVDRKRLSSPD